MVPATKLGPENRVDVLAAYLSEIRQPSKSPDPHELRWELGIYGLDRLFVLRPTRSHDINPTRRRFDVLVGCFIADFGPSLALAPPSDQQLTLQTGGFGNVWPLGGAGGGMRQVAVNPEWINSRSTAELPADYWDKVDVAFEVRAGQVNEWTVPLPDELIQAVREALKQAASPKPKPDPAATDNGN
jgi:hypothetical protein